MKRLLLAAGLLTSCLWTSCASLLKEHVGPVTGLAEGGTISCSQVGVQTPTGWIRPGFRVMSVAARSDWILVAGGVPAERGQLALFDRRGDEVARADLSEDLIYSVAIHPTKPVALAGCADGSVALLMLPNLSISRQLTPHTAPCRVVAFSADGISSASGGLDGLVHLHILASIPPGPPRTTVLKEHTAGVECLLFVGNRLYSGGRDGKVRLHESGKFVRTYLRLGGRVHALCHLDRRVCVGLDDGSLRTLSWDDATSRDHGSTHPIFTMTTNRTSLVAGTTHGIQYLPLLGQTPNR